jgi:hypothetical protein
VKDLFGGTKEQDAIQSLMSIWLRKKLFKGHMVRKTGDERSFADHVNWEKR